MSSNQLGQPGENRITNLLGILKNSPPKPLNAPASNDHGGGPVAHPPRSNPDRVPQLLQNLDIGSVRGTESHYEKHRAIQAAQNAAATPPRSYPAPSPAATISYPVVGNSYVPPSTTANPETPRRPTSTAGPLSTQCLAADGPVALPVSPAEYYMMEEMEGGGRNRDLPRGRAEPNVRQYPTEIDSLDSSRPSMGGILARSAQFARSSLHDVRANAGKVPLAKRAKRAILLNTRLGKFHSENDTDTMSDTHTLEEQEQMMLERVMRRAHPYKQRMGYFTILLVIAQVVFFGTMCYSCGIQPYVDNFFFGPDLGSLSYFGGMNSYLATGSDMQAWRFFSPVLVHSSAINLLLVVAVSLLFLDMFEREWGVGKFFFIYTMTAYGAASLSCGMQPETIQVGSMGAICGIFFCQVDGDTRIFLRQIGLQS
uniref:rhomboid protease n=1 Tax=Corethron hystrix TaxID=216773 RepID=A0A7S1BCT0_9STRA|mmetsp:Transcript_22315/g.51133  ORF Transcript_22315/g.51133 Transcript_22315/m.51133 type:complete len:426 (+) Transcript_22315:245-1522(+)